MIRRRRPLVPLLLALLGAAAAGAGPGVAPAAAQLVTGRLLEATTGEPLDGAFLSLVDAEGVEHASGLSNPQGRFFLRPPRPGRYRLKVERIGFATRLSDVLEVGPGETVSHTMSLSTEAIALEGIRVGGEQRCRVRPGEGERTARLWDEARKALRVAAWTEAQQAVAYRLVRFERTLEPRSGRVLEESRERSTGFFRGSPVKSLPAEDLQAEGYVRAAGENTWDYFAPDARVLLSDPFLDAHCLEIREGEDDREGLVGLGFRPVDEGGPPDIRGVFWLDEATAELRFLEFDYTRLPFPVEADELGGRVEFGRVDGGPWIVRRWSIRMPRVTARREGGGLEGRGVGSLAYELAAIQEVGGEVAQVGGAARAGGGVIGGVVMDGDTAIAGAEVRVAGTEHTAVTDSLGRFRIDGLVGGRYGLEATPPEWPWPWPAPERGEVVLEGGDDQAELRLALPGPAELAASWCPPGADSTAVIAGQVVSPRDGLVTPGARVLVSWNRLAVSGGVETGVVQNRWRAEELRADGLGWYRHCGAPTGVELRLLAIPAGADAERILGRVWDPEARAARGVTSVRLGFQEVLRRQDLEIHRVR